MRLSALRAAGAGLLAVLLSAHVGSPDVYYSGTAGPYAVNVVVRPPQVVPGIARVVVRAPESVRRVSIRPVFWRAGSRGAPSADETHRMEGSEGGGTFEGSLWLMARGAYSVDVIVDGDEGSAHVLVPVASVATGRLALGPALGALLVVLGIVLVAGLINIVYKAAGESLVEAGAVVDRDRARRARRTAAIAVPILAAALLGGARWWGAVDADYQRRMYRPVPLALSLDGRDLVIRARDTLYSSNGRPLGYVPDHGKPMHLFLVNDDQPRTAFAHLHPRALDSGTVPAFGTRVPPLPGGRYHVYADVVDETGFERTMVGSLVLTDTMLPAGALHATSEGDDAWFVGDPARTDTVRSSDGSLMRLQVSPSGLLRAKDDLTFKVAVQDRSGRPVALQPYLGMSAHAVVVRVDGEVYVHLHPMGTVSMAAQEAFVARDRGDTTSDGRLLLSSQGSMSMDATGDSPVTSASFPYSFPSAGSYRVFVQVKHDGRVFTGAWALSVSEPVAP
jgi:hypothetical protein